MELFWTSVLADNILLFGFLGVYLLLEFTPTASEAVRIGLPVAAGMIAAAMAGWALDAYVLLPLGVEALRPWAFVVVVLVIAMVLAAIAGRRGAGFWRGGLLNTAVLGLLLVNAGAGRDGLTVLQASAGSAVGVVLVLVIIGGIMDATESTYVPVPLRGAPIRLIAAGVVAMGVMGFRFPL